MEPTSQSVKITNICARHYVMSYDVILCCVILHCTYYFDMISCHLTWDDDKWCNLMSCNVMSCRVQSCQWCHVMWYDIISYHGRILSCYMMLHHIMSYDATLFCYHLIQCDVFYVLSWNIKPRDMMSCMSCHFILVITCDAIPCHVTSYRIMSCYVMGCNIIRYHIPSQHNLSYDITTNHITYDNSQFNHWAVINAFIRFLFISILS